MAEPQMLHAPDTPHVCQIWTLRPQIGPALRLTNHDRPVECDGEIYQPGIAIEAGAFIQTDGLSPEDVNVDGSVSSEGITDTDVLAGAWDGALVVVELVDWSSGVRICHLWSGRFSDITMNGEAFSATLISLKADLDRVVGRNYSRMCDASLGDARCGVDLSNPALAGQTCDQRFETCVDQFANGDRFRGCPHMPGNDFMLAAPGKAGRS